LISEDLKRNISRVQEEVKKLAPDVKWVAPENLHVTLKFLGNVPETRFRRCSRRSKRRSADARVRAVLVGLERFRTRRTREWSGRHSEAETR